MSESVSSIKPLLILNASAGSGKTYRLVIEYLTLLFEPNAGPSKYRNLAAMTFTNKAAYEMKERILSALFEIANYQEGHEDTQRLITELSERVNLSSADFPEKAGVILSEILHGYEDFLISTIDKFNLKLIKSFNEDLYSENIRVGPISWDGLDDYGDAIGKGVYIYQIQVKGEDGSTAQHFEKLVILK